MENILEAINLTKTYRTENNPLTILSDINFSISAKETCSIIGPSGSGKTTLLGLCAGLDKATSGSVILNGTKLEMLSEDERAALRNQYVGFIFQNFQLIPTLTAIENIMVPLELRGSKMAFSAAKDLLARVGLKDRAHHYPTQLSGGEQQRVAIARAFSTKPQILFADEPTGNLDEETGKKIENLIFELNREEGTTLVLVTHNLELASKTQKIIRIKGGKLVENVSSGNVEVS